MSYPGGVLGVLRGVLRGGRGGGGEGRGARGKQRREKGMTSSRGVGVRVEDGGERSVLVG